MVHLLRWALCRLLRGFGEDRAVKGPVLGVQQTQKHDKVKWHVEWAMRAEDGLLGTDDKRTIK